MEVSSLPSSRQNATWSENATVKQHKQLPQKIICDQGNESGQEQSNETSFPCDRPYNKFMENIANRIKSYKQWPYHICATPLEMSHAGLYYIEDRDRTKCFYCNGGLQNWKSNDNPWEEHAKWYPECPFVLNRKGPEYVHSVNSKFPELHRPEFPRQSYDIPPQVVYNNTNSVITTSSTLSSAASAASNFPELSLGQKVREAMESDLTMQIREFGFSEELLRKAIERRLTSPADMFESMTEFVDAVQAIEQENNTKLSPSLRGGASAPCYSNTEPTIVHLEENMPHHLVNNQVERRIQELSDANRCKICLDRESSCVFGSCGHLCSCLECSSKVKTCPICRQKIFSVIRIYKA